MLTVRAGTFRVRLGRLTVRPRRLKLRLGMWTVRLGMITSRAGRYLVRLSLFGIFAALAPPVDPHSQRRKTNVSTIYSSCQAGPGHILWLSTCVDKPCWQMFGAMLADVETCAS